ALPFLIWNAKGFVLSILFSMTRNPGGDFGVLSIDAALGLVGLVAKLPMFTLMALVFLASWRRSIERYCSVLLVFATFLDFNSVLFLQLRGRGGAVHPVGSPGARRPPPHRSERPARLPLPR